jgi:xanthine dehydrogenase molybdopterin-binding subunit B
MAARQVGRPVKLVLTRAQMYTSNGYRPQTIQHIKISATQDGRLTSLQHHTIANMSTPDIGEFAEPSGLISEMLYACPNVAVTHRLVSLNRPLPTFMRAPGEASGSFALESASTSLPPQLGSTRSRSGCATTPISIHTRTSRFPARRCASATGPVQKLLAGVTARHSRGRYATATC